MEQRPTCGASFALDITLGASMLGLLRLIRGFCGFLIAILIIGLLAVPSWLVQPVPILDSMWAQALINVLALVLFGWLFFKLRSIINRLHTKKHGVPHPVLAEKKWAL